MKDFVPPFNIVFLKAILGQFNISAVLTGDKSSAK